MPWLLDTNVCIELLRGRNDCLRQRLAAHDIADIALCSVVRPSYTLAPIWQRTPRKPCGGSPASTS
jgi:predicted nucleic acid-binding protein